MPALYDAADIYLNSPNIDNMPNSIIEAFAAGLRWSRRPAGGIPHIVTQEQTGLMVDCNDHGALGAAALRLLADPALGLRLTDTSSQEVSIDTRGARSTAPGAEYTDFRNHRREPRRPREQGLVPSATQRSVETARPRSAAELRSRGMQLAHAWMERAGLSSLTGEPTDEVFWNRLVARCAATADEA